jgi:cyclohexyl-isocyanide hydratase
MDASRRSPGDVSVGMVLFPDLTQLDLTGPYEVFARTPGVEVSLLASSLEPVRSERGLAIVPDTTFADATRLDVLFVPGGAGATPAMENEEILGFLVEREPEARYVTSVCTGSLVLGAAGLLRGYRAATHWLSMDLLGMLGAEPTWERVVKDRNRITGGGITAGIDFGLAMAAELCGEATAREIQLMMEYDPEPPFDSGSPKVAECALVDEVRAARREVQERRMEVVKRVRNRLSGGFPA